MKTIHIDNQNSSIYVNESYKNLTKYLPDRQIILVTDKHVFHHYNTYIRKFPHIIIGCEEKVKIWETISYIIDELLKLNADRNTYLIGFGGGLVCDITGFAASIFMRGIRFGFVATSLLAQVDACIGGKNGINFRKYKNMIGTFNAPDFIISDPEVLKTLPQREIKSGFAEVIKHALIKNHRLYNYLSDNHTSLLQLSSYHLQHVLHEAIQVKVAIVSEDYKETGIRKILNFGHTIGHAIENNSHLTHGEAVAIGMVFAARLSAKNELITANNVTNIEKLIQHFGLPTCINISSKKIWKFITKDKKKTENTIDFILLKKIGEAAIQSFDFETLSDEIVNEFS